VVFEICERTDKQTDIETTYRHAGGNTTHRNTTKDKSEPTEDAEVHVTQLECSLTLDFSSTFVRSVVAQLYVVHHQAADVHRVVFHAVFHSTSHQ